MSGEAEKVEPAESEQDEEEDVYEVERIIDMRVEEVKTFDASSTLATELASLAEHGWHPFASPLRFHDAPSTFHGRFVMRVKRATAYDLPKLHFQVMNYCLH